MTNALTLGGFAAILLLAACSSGSSADNSAACVKNMQYIDAAKEAWALQNKKFAGALPSNNDVGPLLPRNKLPDCPAGSTYTLNAIGSSPSCSAPGHYFAPPDPNTDDGYIKMGIEAKQFMRGGK
jgi:hypothetical protein